MTLDALIAAAAAQPATEGRMLPLDEMPIGAFREMVERHLGRDLTDDAGRDLASWLESTVDTTGHQPADADTSVAHLLVDIARGDAASGETASDGADGEERVTFGARLVALARTIGLPVGPRAEIADEGSPADAPIETGRTTPSTDDVVQPAAVRKPFMRPGLTPAQREAAFAAASPTVEPLVIDLRSGDPFQMSAPGGGKPAPEAIAPGSGTLGTIGVSTRTSATLPTAASTAPSPLTGTEGSEAVSTQETATPATTPAPTTVRSGEAGNPLVRFQRSTTPPPSLGDAAPAGEATDDAGRVEPQVRIDLSRLGKGEGAVMEASVPVRGTAPTAASRPAVPPMAVQRILEIVELQATAPPPRMAVVELPELDGLRIMVSVTDRGAVSVTPLGGLTDAAQTPFLQSVATALETQGFQLDERSRGQAEDRREPQGRRPDGGEQRQRRRRPDGLFA